ncbi:MAG: restriction endonuclease subunit S [Phycisphaerae bacterium]|nr:restriction endonuclease subunit S [Phycisphaerae bacterium]NUQ47712.1 restriction endonuclease subunit S [Phycisphaerae bacterium]
MALRLGDVCTKIGSGATPRGGSDVYVSSGVALIRSQNVYNHGFHREGLAYLGETHAAELTGVEVRAGDVLLNITGDSVARCCRAPADVLPARVNQHVAIIRPDPELLDPQYLHYYLISPFKQAEMLSMAGGGGTRNALTKGMIEGYEIPAPDIDEQRAIAGVLGALDDKIEQNRRTSAALERLARAIFRAWFVDFEPVKAKAAGTASFPSMPQPEFDALPTRLVDSPLGPMPVGWEAGKLGDIAGERRETVDPSEVEPTTPYIGLEHMPRRCISLTEWEHAGKVTSGKARFRAGQILFGKLRPYFHKVGIAPLDGVCSTDIVVIEPKSREWFGLTLGHASSDDFVAHTNACSTGTKMPRTNWRDMARYVIAVPPDTVARAFNDLVSAMTTLLVSAIFESRKLAQLRDYLLPKLISGEVRVRDTEPAVERACAEQWA